MDNSTESLNEYNLEKWSLFMYRVYRNDSRWLQVLSVLILVIIFIAGLLGNFLTCTVIYCDKKMHTTTNFYILNMAASDTIVSFGIFMEIYMYFADSYSFGSFACKLHVFFLEVLWNNSILVMTTLAIERYLAILYPLLLKSVPSWKRVMKVMIVIWIIAICETLPELLTLELIKTDSIAICCIVPSFLTKIVNGIMALVTFIIPLLIMLFVYTMIAFKVNVTEKLNSKRLIFNHKDNRSKVTKLTVSVTITLSFLISWVPFFTFRLLIIFCDMRQLIQLEQFWYIGTRIVMINSWFSIVLNPILFSLMSTKFRRALKVLWRTKINRQQHSQIIAL